MARSTSLPRWQGSLTALVLEVAACEGGATADPSALVINRQVARATGWPKRFLAELPPSLTASATLHVEARREFEALVTGLSNTVPAWRIVASPPLGELRAAYQQGEDATGVPWEILAAVDAAAWLADHPDALVSW